MRRTSWSPLVSNVTDVSGPIPWGRPRPPPEICSFPQNACMFFASPFRLIFSNLQPSMPVQLSRIPAGMRFSRLFRLIIASLIALAAQFAHAADTYPHRPRLPARPARLYPGPRIRRWPPLRERGAVTRANPHCAKRTSKQGRIERMQPVSDQIYSPKVSPTGRTPWSSSPGSRTSPSSTIAPLSGCCAPLTYDGEGWGLTRQREVASFSATALSTLRFFDPETFRETRRIIVKDNGKPVKELNELEYIRGEIYANVWHTDRIARVSPARAGRHWLDRTSKVLMPRNQLSRVEK